MLSSLISMMLAVAIAREPASTLPDYTNIDIHRFGIPTLLIRRDNDSEFKIGASNPTPVIKLLRKLNGVPIADLEKRMRPEKLSKEGFLGPDERLVDVLAADNDFVAKHGVSHLELAKHLHAMGVIARQFKDGNTGEFQYHGRRYLIIRATTHGEQDSPFDDGTKSDLNIVVANLENGRKISYSLLLPFLIERYGFYEGKGSLYRLDPKAVLETFDFLEHPDKKG